MIHQLELPLIDATLGERKVIHGDWKEQSALAYQIKSIFPQGKNYQTLTSSQYEALDMIAVKLSRILSGNANEPDHWLDIEGYARLARNAL